MDPITSDHNNIDTIWQALALPQSKRATTQRESESSGWQRN